MNFEKAEIINFTNLKYLSIPDNKTKFSKIPIDIKSSSDFLKNVKTIEQWKTVMMNVEKEVMLFFFGIESLIDSSDTFEIKNKDNYAIVLTEQTNYFFLFNKAVKEILEELNVFYLLENKKQLEDILLLKKHFKFNGLVIELKEDYTEIEARWLQDNFKKIITISDDASFEKFASRFDNKKITLLNIDFNKLDKISITGRKK